MYSDYSYFIKSNIMEPSGYKNGKKNEIKLANWASHQRDNYKRGKLDKDRIKRLEEIGFKWNLR